MARAVGARAPLWSCLRLATDRGRIGKPCLHVDHHLWDNVSGNWWSYTNSGLTNNQKQSLCRGFSNVCGKRPHASYNGTNKVDVEDGLDIDQVEDDSNGQEARAAKSRHSVVTRDRKRQCSSSQAEYHDVQVLGGGMLRLNTIIRQAFLACT